MGTGKERFNPFPDWTTYALLQVWEDEAKADQFFQKAVIWERFQKKAKEQFTLYLKPLQARGKWAGQNPFQRNEAIDPENEYLAVITRATIKTKLLWKFWKYVPHSQGGLHDNPGLIYTKGLGEVPFTQMATFSLWTNTAALNTFAYQKQEHVSAIQKTRTLDWYSEEMFARFQPYRSLGTWMGKDLLPF